MRLRSLEIQGFKSFPDRIKLTFHDGITAVVGPNGSGKSNIADAVRWVLGEQSVKTLRGGRMEDVIFGGTQSRNPQGCAQVQIVLENADRMLPCDSDEVTVSRKLYRSGESEYRLNGAAVRLKDIYELFMDTGLGRDGYSIIGQGRIAEIVSAKSAQRREIFEEAAGISKFRYRKQEAQRRLEGAEENLLRLQDILSELEGRVEPLRVQAEKANAFLALAQEKKGLELSLWLRTLETAKAALNQQEDKLLLAQGDHQAIQQELDSLEAAISACYAQMQQLSVQAEELRAQVQQAEEERAAAASRRAVLENDLVHSEAARRQAQQELDRAGESDSQLDTRIQEQRQQIAGRQEQAGQLRERQQELKVRQQAVSQEQNGLDAKVEALKERRFTLNQSLNETKLSSASGATLIQESLSRLEALRENAVVKDGNIARLEGECADCRDLLHQLEDTLRSLGNSRDGLRLKQQGRREKLDRLARDCQQLEDRARERLQRAKVLFDMENSLEGFSGSVKYVMAQAQKGALQGVCGPVSRLIQVEDRYALAIEIALGASLQHIVVQDEGVAKRAIGMLKSAKAGRATFLPLTTVKGRRLSEPWLEGMEGFLGLAAGLVGCDPQFSGVVDQLLGRVAVAEDLDCATLIAQRGGHRFRVVTLDGQVINAGGSMTGGYAARSAGILSRAKEIETLRAQARGYEDQAGALQTQLKAAREDLSALQAQLQGVEGELATAQEDRVRCEARLAQLESALREAVAAKEQAAQEYSSLNGRLEELRAQNGTNSDLIQALEQQLEQVAQALSGLSAQREAGRTQAEQLAAQRAQLEVELAALEKETDGLCRMVEQLIEQKSHQQEHTQALRLQLEQLEAQDHQTREQIAQAQRQGEQLGEAIQRLNGEIAQHGQQRNLLEAQATGHRAQEKQVTARRETAARELERLQAQRDSLQGEYDGVIAKLWEEYELTRTQAAQLAQPTQDPQGDGRRLAEVKGKIKALGSVNVGAVEEYREVSQRYRFLKEQTQDAQDSRQQLLRLIEKLTSDMRTIFLEEFRQISQNFSKIFVELFGGGRAELTLSDPQDPLESGIEIFVQPPGKIIKNLASLSGGEQAFVAIAIYFAILRRRPAPFCLLDEIEAALDDVNVTRFAQYLRRISGKTQFIAITHRRGTMEAADVLYGVTMQEEGVSKLLELRLDEAEEKLGLAAQS